LPPWNTALCHCSAITINFILKAVAHYDSNYRVTTPDGSNEYQTQLAHTTQFLLLHDFMTLEF